uniref:Death domain-containing protein n=1 Tax=Ciona savignyi TaxID=51511 RepID=H2ZF48_CIOSA
MSSDRVESNIPAIFSKYIRDCNPLLWLKFVRLLGVSNNDIASLISAGDRFGDHEMKYRMLEKWKSIVGLKRDDEYSYYLKKTLDEVNTRNPHDIIYDYHRLNDNIRFARAAYKFIDKHSSVWTQVMHRLLHEADIKNITDMYH